jgi:hypothetical protein
MSLLETITAALQADEVFAKTPDRVSDRSDQSEGKGFFFEKKKQKTFFNLGRAAFTSTGPEAQKFLRRFF